MLHGENDINVTEQMNPFLANCFGRQKKSGKIKSDGRAMRWHSKMQNTGTKSKDNLKGNN